MGRVYIGGRVLKIGEEKNRAPAMPQQTNRNN
jgi:hypothetical protein